MPDLIVREPFAGYSRGASISDPAEVKAILDGPNAHHVIAVASNPAADAPPEKPAVPTPASPGKA
jgi:hypothetical protein